MNSPFFLAIHSKKIALVRKEKENVYLEYVRTFDKDSDVAEAIKSLILEKNPKTITALDSKELLFRKLFLNLKSKKEILKTLPFQLETLFPASGNEMRLHPTFFPKKGGTDIDLIAVSKQTVHEHLERTSLLGVDPDIVSSTAHALFHFAKHFFPHAQTLFIHHEEGEQGIFVVVKEGKMDGFHVHKKEDFERMCTFLKKKYPEIEHILFLKKSLISSPFVNIENAICDLSEFAIPIGLCFDAAQSNKQSGQFRSDMELPSNSKLREKKKTYRFIAVCLGFTALIASIGQLYLNSKEKKMLQLLGLENAHSLSAAVNDLDTFVSTKKTFPLAICTLPKVHEILSWLSTHPNLTDGMTVTHFNYQIVNPPKLGSKNTNYTGKIDLRFTANNLQQARSFHEALKKEKELVDHKHPINWKADNGIYQITFFLKQKQVASQ